VSFLADPSDAPKVLIRGADPTLAVKPEAVDLVFYHGSSCPDGFAAAYAAYTARGSAAQYVPVEHPLDEAALPDVAGRHVVAVDYAFPKAVCERMIARAASFLILDHHASAEKELVQTAPALPARHACFDMKMSGATMAWSFFHPGEEVPLFFRYLEDRDIWRWAFRGSREVCDALSATVPNTFEALEALRGKGAAGIEELMAAGASITKYKETVIDSHVKRAVTGTLKAAPQFKCRFVNGSTLASEIGNVLCERAENKDETVAAIFCACCARSAAARPSSPPFLPMHAHALTHNSLVPMFCAAYDLAKRHYYVSLRSASDAVDVSAICKALGGGGHKRAGGFTCERLEDVLVFADGAPVGAPAEGAGAKRAKAE
jgi:hypothetical protein